MFHVVEFVKEKTNGSYAMSVAPDGWMEFGEEGITPDLCFWPPKFTSFKQTRYQDWIQHEVRVLTTARNEAEARRKQARLLASEDTASTDQDCVRRRRKIPKRFHTENETTESSESSAEESSSVSQSQRQGEQAFSLPRSPLTFSCAIPAPMPPSRPSPLPPPPTPSPVHPAGSSSSLPHYKSAATGYTSPSPGRDLQLWMAKTDRKIDHILTLLEEIKFNQEASMASGGGGPAAAAEQTRASSQLRLNLPVQTEEELGQLNDNLRCQEFRKNAVNFFKTIGGHSYNEAARRMLAKLFLPSLAKKYNFSCPGKMKKMVFKNLGEIVSTLSEAIQSLHTCDDKQLELAFQAWFANRRDSQGGRDEHRMQALMKQMQQEHRPQRQQEDQRQQENQQQHQAEETNL